MPDDHLATTQSTGRVPVGGSVWGTLETAVDRDWFAVRLEAGQTYQFDLKGYFTGDGTLHNPHLRGIYDANGALIPGTASDDGGHFWNSRVAFTAEEDATYYLAAGGASGQVGDYTLSVEEVL